MGASLYQNFVAWCKMRGKVYFSYFINSLDSNGGVATTRARFGRGNGAMWLDDVECKGDEDSLEECQHNPWGQHTCSHREDAGVICNEDPQLGEYVSLNCLYQFAFFMQWKGGGRV